MFTRMADTAFSLGRNNNRDSGGEPSGVESDYRYYSRRAAEEFNAAQRALTEAARTRRLQLAESFRAKAEQFAAVNSAAVA